MNSPGANQEFGYTQEGRDYLRLAEPMSASRPEPLLPRARSLARHGLQDVEIDGRLIRGTVVRGGEASVAYLEFAPFAPEHPPEIAVVDCSCRARTTRCVHVLALMYETVRRVDDDPRLALSLRGYDEALGAEGGGAGDPAPKWTALSALDPAIFYG
ncbi:MAG: hypothetical protein WAW85_12240 [Gordonia sp. (in: high G+C Gram-positive bacteria)]|uniref:hypothetical protein n=1 Tax=Gordonia sp. (in: high G+C Gram-positive bacteria) TaxID=84139 RepID=UPI003BB693C5